MDLKDFVENKMVMSHIYQPVMIKTLLLNKGRASKTVIAKAILSYDFSQVEYYEKTTNNMVGKVLRSHNVVAKNKNEYSLIGFDDLSHQDVFDLIKSCEDKIETYIKKRGDRIWEHRRKNRKPVSGSIRYQVLKRARGKCELCGISKEEKALEVDHIVPKNLGGEDSINNYQALCYTCNANKRDTDDTDFRHLEEEYGHRVDSCIFCKIEPERIIFENNLAIAFLDKYPVSEGHALVIPKRHCEIYFDLTQAELNAINSLTHEVSTDLQSKYSDIDGFNIGFNSGESAGQTIFHCHQHIIPRRNGDVQDPRGGIRHIIPGRGYY